MAKKIKSTGKTVFDAERYKELIEVLRKDEIFNEYLHTRDIYKSVFRIKELFQKSPDKYGVRDKSEMERSIIANKIAAYLKDSA